MRLQKWFQLNPLTRPQTSCEVYRDADLSSATYWLGILLSAGIATFGLVENSPAVIIGAMIISPLMGPIMATGLGLATGDAYLTLKAMIKLIVSIALAVLLSAVLVWVLPFHSTTNEILSRTNPTLLDLGIALLSGIAGSVAVNRAGGDDGTTTLPGVAIAVALMPPLCTVGFGVGTGWNRAIIGGAALLFLTNLVAIVFSAFVLFLMAGMNTPKVRAGLLELRAGEGLAQRLARGRMARFFSEGTQLRWRALLPIVLLVALAVPLARALRQLESEAVARDVTQRVIGKLVPGNALVAQQTEVTHDAINVRLVVTRIVEQDAVQRAEQEIAERSDHTAHITVETVASQHELSQLVDKLKLDAETVAAPVAAAPVATAPVPLVATGEHVRERVGNALADIWPAAVDRTDFEVAFTPDGATVNVTYAAKKPLDALTVNVMQTALRQSLSSPKLLLTVTQIAAAQPKASTGKMRHAATESILRRDRSRAN